MLLEPVDFTKIPDNLIDTFDSILDPNRPMPDNLTLPRIQGKVDYRRRIVSDELRDWIRNNIPIINPHIQYQIMSTPLPMHKDMILQ